MPKAPKKPCRKYGCPDYQEKDGFCLDHWRPRVWDKDKHSDRRYHIKAWQYLRAEKIRSDPVCEMCNEKVSDTVHHIVPINDAGDFFDWDNLMALCRNCHERIHGRKK